MEFHANSPTNRKNVSFQYTQSNLDLIDQPDCQLEIQNINDPRVTCLPRIWAHSSSLSLRSKRFENFFSGIHYTFDFEEVKEPNGTYMVIKVPLENPEITNVPEILNWVSIPLFEKKRPFNYRLCQIILIIYRCTVEI